MKLVTTIIKPAKLDAVREALNSIGIKGMTITEVKGYGHQKGNTEIYRGAEFEIKFLLKIKVEVAVSDSLLDQTLAAIREGAQTGNVGDGKIFVSDIEQAVRIRTGETGDAVL